MSVGCTRKIYVPTETVRTEYRDADTTAIYNHLRSMFESIREKEKTTDSVLINTKETIVVDENGEVKSRDREHTVYKSTSRERELERELAAKESLIRDLRTQLTAVKTDSVSVPYPIEVEKKQTKWDSFRLATWWWLIGITSALAVWLTAGAKVRRWINRIKKI